VTSSSGRCRRLAFGLACTVGLSAVGSLATPAYGKGTTTTVARNARLPRGPKLDKLPFAKPTVPRVVSLTAATCKYDPKTHQVLAGGTVKWVPAGGDGALGTVTAVWSAPATKRQGRHKASPGFSVSATSQQFFYGSWSLSDNATTKPARCTLTLNFAAPTASSVTAYVQAKGLPITGLIVYNASTDPNHLLGRPTGYLSKDAWQDPRIDQSDQPSDPGGVEWGGGFEVFSTTQAAQERASYISSIDQASSLFGSEYDYLLGPILMRISGTFTPTTAQTYGTALTGSTLYIPQPPGVATTTTTAP
jgi:plastocyanin